MANFAGSSSRAQACTFYISNKCPFPIWPATASNTGQPVIAKGGFYLPPAQTKTIQAPGTWSGRIWARTGCNFNYDDTKSNGEPACETGDCQGQLECNGKIGLPPATLVEISLQVEALFGDGILLNCLTLLCLKFLKPQLQAGKSKPSFYDVSLVDGYNLPVSVSTKPASKKCQIRGCQKNLKNACPEELQILNEEGEVAACKSACLAFNDDKFCCRNEFGSPETCKPSVYSKIFKDACPSYFSYAFDTPSPLVNCPSDAYVITFCPSKWGSENTDM